MSQYPLIGFRGARTVVEVGSATFGGGGFPVIAGPCAVESIAQITETAEAVAGLGADLLRGGAFKPRTSPYTFQGLGEEGLSMLVEAGRRVGLGVVSEVLSPEDIPLVASSVDMIQIGSRNMTNFSLLKAVGKTNLPILLKRGYMSTVEETLLAAEHIAAKGNDRIILCERGIRAFDTSLRFTYDLAGALLLREQSRLPVIGDPSHATGCTHLVEPLAIASQAAGL
nr:3-deoxy-7-phosphoheptulonate synthase [bacterium]